MPSSRLKLFIRLVAVLVATSVTSPLFAHKMEVKAVAVPVSSPAADSRLIQVRIEAWYEYGDPADADWWITGPAGGEVARGVLDPDTGRATAMIRVTREGDYKITVDDGAGHREAVLLHLNPTAQEPTPVGVQSPQRNRWLMGVIGMALIAGLAVAARRLTRPLTSAQ